MTMEGQTIAPEVVATPTPEVTPTTPPVEPKVDPQVSAKFQALAKREKSIVQKMQEAKAIEAKLAEREARLAELEKKYQEENQIWESDPLTALTKKNLSYEKLTELVLSGQKLSPEMIAELKAKEAVMAYEKKQEEKARLKAEEDAKAAEAQAAEQIEEFKVNMTEHIKSKPDDYEFINLYGLYDQVYEVIAAHFEETSKQGQPKVLSMDEAAKMVEDFYEGEALKAMNSKKIKSKLTPSDKKSETDKGQPQSSSSSTVKTLSNAVTAQAGATPPAKTDQERWARAMAALDK